MSNADGAATEPRSSGWISLYPDHNGIIHVLPNFGRVHLGHPGCWCNPHFDPVWEWVLIHECDN